MSTVFGIVRQHDGNIEVYSEPGRGTTVKVYLPRVDGEADQPVPEPVHSTAAEHGETVLIVEDDEIVSNLCSEILQLQGYSVLSAANPADALDAAASHQGAIDLLLTDLVLPGMDGATLYRKLAEVRPAMKVLYVSGYSKNWVTSQGILQEESRFLQKPFTADLLAARVHELLCSQPD